MTLPAFAAGRRSCYWQPAAVQQSIDIHVVCSCPPGSQQQTRRSGVRRPNDGTDGRTDRRTERRTPDSFMSTLLCILCRQCQQFGWEVQQYHGSFGDLAWRQRHSRVHFKTLRVWAVWRHHAVQAGATWLKTFLLNHKHTPCDDVTNWETTDFSLPLQNPTTCFCCNYHCCWSPKSLMTAYHP